MRYIYQYTACLIMATSMMASDTTQITNYGHTPTATSVGSEILSTYMYPLIGYTATYAGLHAANKVRTWYNRKKQWEDARIAYYDGYDASFYARRLASVPILGYYAFKLWPSIRNCTQILEALLSTPERNGENASQEETQLPRAYGILGVACGIYHFAIDNALELRTRNTTTIKTRMDGENIEARIEGTSTHGSPYTSFYMPPSQLLENDFTHGQDSHDPRYTILLTSRATENIIRSRLQELRDNPRALKRSHVHIAHHNNVVTEEEDANRYNDLLQAALSDDMKQRHAPAASIITDHTPLLPRLPRLRTIHDTGECNGMPVWTVRPQYIDHIHQNERPEHVSKPWSQYLHTVPQTIRNLVRRLTQSTTQSIAERESIRTYEHFIQNNSEKDIGIREIDNVADPRTNTLNAHGELYDAICDICSEKITQNDHHRLRCEHSICVLCWDGFKTNFGRQENDGIWRYSCPLCRRYYPIANIPESS